MEAQKIEEVTLATRTYQVKNGRIMSMIDGREAMAQAIEKALLTARYEVPWLSKNYGSDIDDLVGKSVDYAKMEIGRMIMETFISDKRVTGVNVDDITIIDKTTVMASATVSTVFGAVEIQKEVSQ